MTKADNPAVFSHSPLPSKGEKLSCPRPRLSGGQALRERFTRLRQRHRRPGEGIGRRRVTGNPDGMALVLTLMVVAIITAVVVEFAYGVYVNTNALYNWQTSQKLSLAARSATKLASSLISQYGRQPLAYPGFIEMSRAIPAGDLNGTITIRIEDENAKLNLNSLVSLNGKLEDIFAYPAFVRLLDELELKPEIADRIADWIDPDDEPRLHDSEISAKNAYLDSIDELLLIPGIDRETYDKLFPYVTIYGGDGRVHQININSADIIVLMSLSDSIDKSVAENVVAYREITPFKQPAEILSVAGFDLGTVGSQYIAVKGSVFRVVATAESGGITRVIESVLSGGTVNYWKEY